MQESEDLSQLRQLIDRVFELLYQGRKIGEVVVKPLESVLAEYHEVDRNKNTSITNTTGTLSLNIPAMALSENRFISVRDTVMEVPGGNIGPVYSITDVTFSTPATIKYHYNENNLRGHTEEDIVLYTYNNQTGKWKPVPNQTKDKTANEISAQITHLSLYTLGTITTPVEEIVREQLPTTFQLYQNYPNPFNPSTTIKFDLPRDSNIEATIYNIMGQPVKHLYQGRQPAGQHTLQWDGTNDNGQPVSSAVYILQVQGAGFNQARKMLLLK